jgi:hypothetical protein
MADIGKNEVALTNVTAKNIVGRDSFDNSLSIINQHESSSYIKDLYEKFEVERNSDPELKDLCEELSILNTQVQNEEVVGLENKLKAGGQIDYYITYATELKDKFYRKLMINAQYSLAAQEINTHLLTKVKRTFRMEIFPLLCNKEPLSFIEQVITERIIIPVRTELGLNLFKYTDEDISGMIFFLTGTCHLKWCA